MHIFLHQLCEWGSGRVTSLSTQGRMPPAPRGMKLPLEVFSFLVVPSPACRCHLEQSSGGTSALRQKAAFAQGLLREKITSWGQLSSRELCRWPADIARQRAGRSGSLTPQTEWREGWRWPGWLCACSSVSGQLLTLREGQPDTQLTADCLTKFKPERRL